MAKTKVLDLSREVGLDDELLKKLKRLGVKVKDRKSEEPEKTTGRSYEKIIKRDAEKEVVEKLVEPKPIKGELKLLQNSVKEEADPVTYYIIDGLNVLGWEEHSKPSVAILLTLIIELCKRNWPFISFFDANTQRKLVDQEVPVYENLKKSYCDFFSEVPGGSEADEFILFHASKTNGFIISNDRYRDYQKKYEWLTPYSTRLIKGRVTGKNLMIPNLDLHLPIKRELSVLLKEMTVLIKNLTPSTNISVGNRRRYA